MSWSDILSNVGRLKCQLHACLELLNITVPASFIHNLFPRFINLFRIFHTCIGVWHWMPSNTKTDHLGSRDHFRSALPGWITGMETCNRAIRSRPAVPGPDHWCWQLKGKSVNVEAGSSSLCIVFLYQLYRICSCGIASSFSLEVAPSHACRSTIHPLHVYRLACIGQRCGEAHLEMRGTWNLEHVRRLCGKTIKNCVQVAVNFRIKLCLYIGWESPMK